MKSPQRICTVVLLCAAWAVCMGCASRAAPFSVKSHLRAARVAATDWRTFVPIGAGIVFDAANWDRDVSKALAGTRRRAESDANRRAGIASYFLLYGTLATSVAVSAHETMRSPENQVFRNTLATGLTSFGLNAAFKDGWNRKRPDGDGNASFYSGHASNAAWASAALRYAVRRSSVFSTNQRCHLDMALTLVPLATGVLRVSAKKHYPSDVLVGWGVGNFFGTYFGELGHACWMSKNCPPAVSFRRHHGAPAIAVGIGGKL